MATNLQAVLFDLGGTLLHYQKKKQPDFRATTMRGITHIYAALPDFGHQPPPETEFAEVIKRHIAQAYSADLQQLRGGSIETPLRSALNEMGLRVDTARWDDLRQHFYKAMDEVVSLRSGVRDTLVALRQRGLKLALISNTYWAADLHDRHLQQFNLLDLLPQRTYSSDAQRTKPHPAIFLDALADLGLRPQAAVYVGDNFDIDIVGAKGAGLRAVLIRSPFIEPDEPDAQQPHEATPDAIIDELPDLLDSIASWQ